MDGLSLYSDIAFGAVTVFSMKRLFVEHYAQEKVVSWTMLLADLGLALILVVLAMLLLWRLFDLFKKKGLWMLEKDNPELEVKKTSSPSERYLKSSGEVE